MKKILLLIFSIVCASVHPYLVPLAIASTAGCGPKNKTDQPFAILTVIRPHSLLDSVRWYGLMYGNISLGTIENNSKTQIQFPLSGKQSFWAQAPKSIASRLSIDVAFGKNYYILMTFTPGEKNADPVLTLLDSAAGELALQEVNGEMTLRTYPVPFSIPEGMLTNNSFNTSPAVAYQAPKDSINFWRYQFKPPACYEYLYLSKKYVIQYPYANSLTSPTYTEFLRIGLSSTKKMTDSIALFSFVKRILGNGPKGKNLKATTLTYEPIESSIGKFGWMAISEVEDYSAANKSDNKYLLTREVRVFIYTESKEKDPILVTFWLSIRGTYEELYNLDEMKEKMNVFLSGWKLAKAATNESLPNDSN